MTARKIVGALLILVSLTFACRTAPVHDVNRSDVPPGLSVDEVGDVIERAARQRGWSVVRQAPAHIVASIVVRGRHRASVDITFDQKAFSIRHRDSENLRYDGERIHRNYNSWILRLEQTIRDELFLQEQKRANSRT